MEEKIIKVGPGAVEKFLSGVDKMDALVGGTLGPAGRNRIIYRKYRSPLVTNDGVTVARHAYLADEVEDLAAQTLVEIAMKTNETAGDGTTTSIVIAAELVRSCLKRVQEAEKATGGFASATVNPMQLARDIRAEVGKALKLLADQKVELAGTMLDDVISTSLENLEYGKELGELLRKVGKDGYIAVEDNWATKYGIETELTEGMRFLGTYASPYFAGERNEKEALWEDALVLVTNQKLDAPAVITKLVREMTEQKKFKLVIIGGHSENVNPFSKEFISGCARLLQAVAQGKLNTIQILAVKCPSLTSDELQDVAVFCNAKFFNTKLGENVADAQMMHLGQAKKVVVNEDDVNLLGGAGSVENRIEVLKEQMEREKDPMFKEKTLRRIASLSAGVGIIRVGAPTEQERTYLKYKLEDAVHAARAAMEEGTVRGGGLALREVADKLGAGSVLFSALLAPYTRIQENAGGDLEVPESIVDPHKVVRLALANACSAGATLITCDGAIADRKLTVLDYFEKKLGKLNPATDDFRDNENQDLGRGRIV